MHIPETLHQLYFSGSQSIESSPNTCVGSDAGASRSCRAGLVVLQKLVVLLLGDEGGCIMEVGSCTLQVLQGRGERFTLRF